MPVLLHYLCWSLGLTKADTQTTEGERECLARHASGRRALVEIGVFEGVTTCVLRRAMDPDGILYAVDPFAVGRLGVSLHRRIARREVAATPGGSVVWLETTGHEAAAHDMLRSTAVDFVFVDGDHSWEGIERDWRAWSGKIAEKGVLALHDSRESQGAGSQRYMNEVIARDTRFAVVDSEFRVTVIQRL